MSKSPRLPLGERREAYAAAIGKVLRKARMDAGVNITELANRCGLSIQTISSIERAEYEIDFFETIAFCEGIGASPQVVVKRVMEAMRET